jgi:hypothetical protein
MVSSDPSPIRTPILFLLGFIFLFAIAVNFALLERISRPVRHQRQQAKASTIYNTPKAVVPQPVGNVADNPLAVRLIPRSI